LGGAGKKKQAKTGEIGGGLPGGRGTRGEVP